MNTLNINLNISEKLTEDLDFMTLDKIILKPQIDNPIGTTFGF